MTLRDVLWISGVILTLIAVGVLVAMVLSGQNPGLPAVVWTAIALLLASRDAR